MSRSRASAKKAGSQLERDVADHLAATVDDRIDRAVKRGTKDVGDVGGLRFHGHKIAVEVKNTSKVSLSTWASEVEVERQNLGALAGIIVHKRHGKGYAGDQWVTMTLDNFVALMTLMRVETDGFGRADGGPGTGPEARPDSDAG